MSLALALMLLISGGQLLRHLHGYAAGQACSTQARQIAGRPEPSAVSEPPSPQETPDEAAPEPDLAALRQTNPDVVGWIELPGTELSYPLMQGTDNEFYLTHQWDGSPGSCGAIFLDADSRPDLSDWHSRIYGHRMNDASMFGLLRRYRDADFQAAHPEFLIWTDAGVQHYRIFAAYETPVSGPIFQPEPETTAERRDFLAYALEHPIFSTGNAPTSDHPVVTLSTCTGHGHQKRWVVQGSLVAVS